MTRTLDSSAVSPSLVGHVLAVEAAMHFPSTSLTFPFPALSAMSWCVSVAFVVAGLVPRREALQRAGRALVSGEKARLTARTYHLLMVHEFFAHFCCQALTAVALLVVYVSVLAARLFVPPCFVSLVRVCSFALLDS